MNTEELLPCVEREPAAGPARASVLWLHGLGADGHDFEPIVPLLGLEDAGVRFVFPHAPSMPVTVNGGFVMPAWYDIVALGGARQDVDGLRRSAARVARLVERERERGVPSERIVLAGFSQGGAVAAHLALRSEERLAGLVLLSTYLVDAETVEAEATEASRGLPVFQAHGLYDEMVTPQRGAAARAVFEGRGHPLAWHEYPIAHEVCEEEIKALGSWLGERLTP